MGWVGEMPSWAHTGVFPPVKPKGERALNGLLPRQFTGFVRVLADNCPRIGQPSEETGAKQASKAAEGSFQEDQNP